MKFVILVAGVGSRLRPLTDEKPKCLIEVGGQSILERLLTQAIQTQAFTEALLLTGYRSEAIESFASDWNQRVGVLPVRTVHNPKYEETNNGYSLWCAKDLLAEGFVLSDGDLVLEEALLDLVAKCDLPDGSHSLLAVDQQSRLDAEAMKFITNSEGHVVGLSKDISVEEGEGESIGLCRIGAPDVQAIVDHLDVLVQTGQVNEYYERAFQEYVTQGWTPAVLDIGHYGWVEIDDQTDLERARSRFGNL